MWAHDRMELEVPGVAHNLHADDFNANVMRTIRDRVKKRGKEPQIDKPEAFKAKNWKKWKEQLVNCLISQPSAKPDVPLSYMIRGANRPDDEEYDEMDAKDRRIWDARMDTESYDLDNRSL